MKIMMGYINNFEYITYIINNNKIFVKFLKNFLKIRFWFYFAFPNKIIIKIVLLYEKILFIFSLLIQIFIGSNCIYIIIDDLWKINFTMFFLYLKFLNLHHYFSSLRNLYFWNIYTTFSKFLVRNQIL